MMKTSTALAFLAIFALFAIIHADEAEDRQHFKDWCTKHNKKYKSTEEEETAMKNMLSHKKKIDEHNKQHREGKKSYKLKLAEHSDMTNEEISERMMGFDNSNVTDTDSDRVTRAIPHFPKGPASIDWREKGLVGPVENQGQCGSCWAFSSTAVIDALIRKRNGNKLASPQQLVDCFKGDCHGSNPATALTYAKRNGITDEHEYPYTAHASTCTYDEEEKLKKATIKKVMHIQLDGDEEKMKDIVGKVGPVAIGICVPHEWKHFGAGVFNDDNCCATPPSHSPVVVGYGTDPKGGDYWIVKNSWGLSFGEDGYIKMSRNKNNQCRIADFVTYAE